MSPRRHRRAPQPDRRGAGGGFSANEIIEDGPDGRWRVRNIRAGQADKTYRCPGCDQEIRPKVPHVVAWPDDGQVDERRHWHTPCWRARRHRRPTRRW